MAEVIKRWSGRETLLHDCPCLEVVCVTVLNGTERSSFLELPSQDLLPSTTVHEQA